MFVSCDKCFRAQIADGIAALKAAAGWPMEAKTPAFNDEAATVYVNFVPKKTVNPNISRKIM
jgi:hypothetical protein